MSEFTMTIAVGDICSHQMNGWWVTVPFFFGWFSKYVYVCSDCRKVLTESEYDANLNKEYEETAEAINMLSKALNEEKEKVKPLLKALKKIQNKSFG